MTSRGLLRIVWMLLAAVVFLGASIPLLVAVILVDYIIDRRYIYLHPIHGNRLPFGHRENAR